MDECVYSNIKQAPFGQSLHSNRTNWLIVIMLTKNDTITSHCRAFTVRLFSRVFFSVGVDSQIKTSPLLRNYDVIAPSLTFARVIVWLLVAMVVFFFLGDCVAFSSLVNRHFRAVLISSFLMLPGNCLKKLARSTLMRFNLQFRNGRTIPWRCCYWTFRMNLSSLQKLY